MHKMAVDQKKVVKISLDKISLDQNNAEPK